MTNNVYSICESIRELREERSTLFSYLNQGNFIDVWTKQIIDRRIEKIGIKIARLDHAQMKLIISGEGAL